MSTSKTRIGRLCALLFATVLALSTISPALAFPPTPVTGADSAYGPDAVPAGISVEGVTPASLRTANRTIQTGVKAQVQALAALGDTQVRVSVLLTTTPLASLSKDMTADQRVTHAAAAQALREAVIADVEAAGGIILGRFTTLANGFTAVMSGREAARLATRPEVVRVSQVRDYELDLSETVPWIGGETLQNLGLTGKGVNVAVLDSGIDFTHRSMGGPGTREAWEAAYFGDDPTCLTGRETTCANRKPADPAFFGPNAPKVKGGYDWVGETWVRGLIEEPDINPIPADNTGGRDGTHGTHVADIIAGLGYPAGAGYPAKGPGMAPEANLWSFKVCSSLSTACSGVALLNAMDDAADLDNNPATVDPADIINMSLGSIYGQPEDDLSYFTNQAVAYGIIVVASAGNSGDKPYVAGSPSVADGAISVAQTTVPSAKQFILSVEQPAAISGTLKSAVFQPWSVPLSVSGAISGSLQYGNADGSNRLGCDPFTDDLTGKIVLMDRGVCAFSIKGANASAAGALMGIIGLVAPGDPFEGGYGGGAVTIPVFMISQAESNKLKSGLAQGVIISAGPDKFIGMADSMVGSSSRGPTWNNKIKPDIGAPGASVSAISGSGSGSGPFGGTSGAAPMVSGAAALLKGFFEQGAGMQQADGGGFSWFPQMYRALLMNTAKTAIYLDGAMQAGGGGTLAPITRIGAGQVDVAKAYMSRLVAWDSTDTNPLKWTGSISFGYQPVTDTYVATRILTVRNLSPFSQGIRVSSVFRYANDVGKGVTITLPIQSALIPGRGEIQVPVQLEINAAGLRAWGLNKGSRGANGPLFTTQEVDGYVKIETCTGSTCTSAITVPWQVLPKAVADINVTGTNQTVILENVAPAAASNTEVFALVDRSANLYNYMVGSCVLPGGGPGCQMSAVDLKEVGVRDWLWDSNNDGTPESYVEFGLTVYDWPYRAGQYPVEFDIYVDANRDGNTDYIVFNADVALNGSDGRNAVFVYNMATKQSSVYFYTDSDFNTQNWILTVPAAAIGLVPGRQFNFYVLAFDAYFGGGVWDCSPFAGGRCGTAAHTYTVGRPRFDVGEANLSLTIPPQDQAELAFTRPAGGFQASPSQIGFLFMHRKAPIGRESSTYLPTPWLFFVPTVISE